MAGRKRVRKARRQRGKLNKQTLMSMAAVGSVVVVLLLVLGIKGMQLKEKNASYEKTKQELQAQLDQEQERTQQIEAYSDYVNSDEYIEKIAKERLGLVKDNEIVFYSGTEKNGGAVDDSAQEDDTDWSYDEEDYDDSGGE